ncbi:MAG: hypothetical protein QM723_03090 [Myxococcaceae bacterium]
MKLKTPVGTPAATVRVKKGNDLVEAAQKKAEELGSDTGSHHVLVVYQDNEAKLFCEPRMSPPVPRPSAEATGPQTPLKPVVVNKGN